MAASQFREARLGDVADFQEGYVNPSQKVAAYFGDEVKWLRAVDLNDSFVSGTTRCLSRVGFESAGKSALLFEPGTLAISKSGTIGRLGILKDYMCGNRAVINIIPRKNRCDTRFLFYILLHSRRRIDQLATGSVQRNLYCNVLGSLDVLLPPLPIQKKIVSILSAYDDLIENNERRIKILEDMAQNLYREWFVNFRFPGHEKVKMVDSPLGQIPEGWEVKTVGEVLAYHIGGGWGKEVADDKHTEYGYVIRGTDIPRARVGQIESCPYRCHKESNMRSRTLSPGDIVFEVSGGSKGQPVGRALLMTDALLRQFDDDVICASFCKLLRVGPAILSCHLLYRHLLEIYTDGRIDKYQVQSTGITNFKFQFFLDSAPVLVARTEVQERFSQHASPLMTYVHELGARNDVLRQTRDLLLPKLISGELDVSELDIEVSEGAA